MGGERDMRPDNEGNGGGGGWDSVDYDNTAVDEAMPVRIGSHKGGTRDDYSHNCRGQGDI